MRPAKGTISAQVWELAEAMLTNGAPPVRSKVVAAAIVKGIHAKTASTQFGAWKRAHFPGTPRQATRVSLPTDVPAPSTFATDRHWASLLKNGFAYGSDWVLSGIGEISLDKPAPTNPGVYIFVLDDQVVYIGTTRRKLADRMADYRRGHAGQKTSARIRALILETLQMGKTLRVLYASPGEEKWNNLPVEISAGLEAGLISTFQPPWNRKGKQS
jgi:hypothetical protein